MSLGFYGRYEVDSATRHTAAREQEKAEMQRIVQLVNDHARTLNDEERQAAKSNLGKRTSNAWLERRKKEREPDNISSMAEAVKIFADAGYEVADIKKVHKHFAFLNGDVYYIHIKDTSEPFVVRCDTGAVYDRKEFDQKFPPQLANV